MADSNCALFLENKSFGRAFDHEPIHQHEDQHWSRSSTQAGREWLKARFGKDPPAPTETPGRVVFTLYVEARVHPGLR
jgi:hypothetical protein